MHNQARIVVSSLSDDRGIEQLYAGLNQAKSENTTGNLELDLSRVNFVTPNGVLSLIAAIRLWSAWTDEKVILSRLAPNVLGYLERVNFLEMFGSKVVLTESLSSAETYLRSFRSKSLMELREFSSDWAQNALDVIAAVDHAAAILVDAYGSIESCSHVLTMFSEIAANIPHSQDTGLGLIQKYDDQKGLRRRVIIAVSDLGVGIQQSLQDTTRYESLLNAKRGSDYIRLALQSGVTSRPESERRGGLGLHSVDREVTHVSGTLRIRSAQSVLRRSSSNETVLDNLPPIPGTHVSITVRAPPKG